MNKKERINFCESLMTHMVYVGYNTDPYGAVNIGKLRIVGVQMVLMLEILFVVINGSENTLIN